MQALLSKLPAFALPFVTRSLRGGRGRRYVIFSLILAALTSLIGMWLTLGSGTLEQSLRTDLGVEAYEYEVERETFTVLTHDPFEHRRAKAEIATLEANGGYPDTYYGEAYDLFEQGQTMVRQAAVSPAADPSHNLLHQRAAALIDDPQFNQYGGWDNTFPWHDSVQVRMLEAVLDHDGIPQVAAYSSPLGVADGLKLIGMFAGMLLAGLATVFAPLLVAVQQAQERHENTLMPLTGTALSPRELAVGLAAGPTAVIGIFAAPQLLIFLVCALLVGEIFVAGALLAALAATGALFIFGAQLLGQLMGDKRTPGIIGIALMCLTGVAWLAGAGLMSSGEHDIAGISAVLPHLGLSALLVETFFDVEASFSQVFVGAFVWIGGAVILGWLTMNALSRRIEGSGGVLLDRWSALIGALTCIALVNVAIPDLNHSEGFVRQYVGLGMLALPLALLLMSRVPTGDGHPRMRSVPVPALLLEFGSWGVLHLVIVAALFGSSVESLHPVALGWLVWCTAVLALIAIRIVAVPGKIAANLWAGFCAMSLLVGFGQAIFWADGSGHHGFGDVFVMSGLSPVLGLLQIALTIWIPTSLVLHLRKSLRAIS
ncbi:hypothetical protein [Enhygromyxa salina]|uniref:ABC-2 family transporter protein n=1 Tax=Enhygromyxa salina TaxID=215803 RepID=A0A2S9YLQ8_9BACT|nr:hypothetical protein [Enhygromyxa salina]PRQ06043.1 hypothetical protein ENSA7_43050 [Enhygromyxa salina]